MILTRMTSATISLSYKKTNNFIYQTILIVPTKRSHLRYFTMSKYAIGRQLDDMFDKLYIGDGENIFFREKQKFRNQITIKYEVVNKIDVDLNEKKYHIQGAAPKHDGCAFCRYLRQPNRGRASCAYYKKFLPRLKIFCVDFVEKD